MRFSPGERTGAGEAGFLSACRLTTGDRDGVTRGLVLAGMELVLAGIELDLAGRPETATFGRGDTELLLGFFASYAGVEEEKTGGNDGNGGSGDSHVVAASGDSHVVAAKGVTGAASNDVGPGVVEIEASVLNVGDNSASWERGPLG